MKNARSLLLYACLTAFLAACAPQNLAAEPTPAPCLPADLVAPVHVSPATDYEIIPDLDHIFVWSYSSCEPDGWRVELALHDPDTYDQYLVIDQFGLPVPAQTSWVFDQPPLQPATAYEWHVEAFIAGVEGPYSNTTIFWTGPICETADLTAPAQISPTHGGTLEFFEGPLMWNYSGACVPEFTFVELGTNPGLGGTNLTSGLGPPRRIAYPADPLEDCSEYFWRVRSQSTDGEGPWSPVWSFTTDFEGICSEQGGGAPIEPGPPQGLATRDLNCRAGDATAFNETGFFPEGEIAEIIGRNAAGTWYVVPLRLGGGNCWVSAQYVELLNDYDPADLSIIASPRLPTATPTSPPATPTFPPPQ